MDQYITEQVLEPEGDEVKDAHKRSIAKAKRIIAYSIKDHLIPHVSSLKTLKELFDALTNLFEGKNITKDDIKEPTKECKDTELRDHAVLLHKGCSNQTTT